MQGRPGQTEEIPIKDQPQLDLEGSQPLCLAVILKEDTARLASDRQVPPALGSEYCSDEPLERAPISARTRRETTLSCFRRSTSE